MKKYLVVVALFLLPLISLVADTTGRLSGSWTHADRPGALTIVVDAAVNDPEAGEKKWLGELVVAGPTYKGTIFFFYENGTVDYKDPSCVSGSLGTWGLDHGPTVDPKDDTLTITLPSGKKMPFKRV